MKQPVPSAYTDFDFEQFIERPQVRAFIGKNYDHYREIWTRDYEKRGRNPVKMQLANHWNTLAFLASLTAWLCYRKMFGYAFLWTALLTLLVFLDEYFHWNVSSGAYVAINLVMLMRSKNIYFDHVVRFFYRHRDTDPVELGRLIQKQGGVSTLWAVIGGIAGLAFVIAAGIFADMLSPQPMAIDMDNNAGPIPG